MENLNSEEKNYKTRNFGESGGRLSFGVYEESKRREDPMNSSYSCMGGKKKVASTRVAFGSGNSRIPIPKKTHPSKPSAK